MPKRTKNIDGIEDAYPIRIAATIAALPTSSDRLTGVVIPEHSWYPHLGA
jgi:hypothetical protein